jgi:hypothetical protein
MQKFHHCSPIFRINLSFFFILFIGIYFLTISSSFAQSKNEVIRHQQTKIDSLFHTNDSIIKILDFRANEIVNLNSKIKFIESEIKNKESTIDSLFDLLNEKKIDYSKKVEDLKIKSNLYDSALNQLSEERRNHIETNKKVQKINDQLSKEIKKSEGYEIVLELRARKIEKLESELKTLHASTSNASSSTKETTTEENLVNEKSKNQYYGIYQGELLGRQLLIEDLPGSEKLLMAVPRLKKCQLYLVLDVNNISHIVITKDASNISRSKLEKLDQLLESASLDGSEYTEIALKESYQIRDGTLTGIQMLKNVGRITYDSNDKSFSIDSTFGLWNFRFLKAIN